MDIIVDENTPLAFPCPATPTRGGKNALPSVNSSPSCHFSTPRRRKTAGLTDVSTSGTLKQWPRILMCSWAPTHRRRRADSAEQGLRNVTL